MSLSRPCLLQVPRAAEEGTGPGSWGGGSRTPDPNFTWDLIPSSHPALLQGMSLGSLPHPHHLSQNSVCVSGAEKGKIW